MSMGAPRITLLCEWLILNGIDPNEISQDSEMTLVGDQLTVEYVVRRDDGRIWPNSTTSAPLTRTRTFTVVGEMP